MKAAVIERQGGLDGLVYRDWPDPIAGPGEALIRVRACGLNHLDIFVRRGMPGFPVPMPFISGGDIAGTVEALGDGTTGFSIGDHVLVNPSTDKGMLGEQLPGGMAELVAAPASHLVPIPEGVSFREAACLPVAYGTARRMLIERAAVQPGELVLVLGASGGVGNGCIQIGKDIGAEMIAAAGSDEKLAKLKEMGATHLINYRSSDFSKEAWAISNRKGVDVVVNFTGGETWAPSLRTLRKSGRLVTCGATAGFDPKTDIRYIWVRELTILGSDGWTTNDIRALLAMVEAGTLKPEISHILPLANAREAEELIEDREIFGKVILEP